MFKWQGEYDCLRFSNNFTHFNLRIPFQFRLILLFAMLFFAFCTIDAMQIIHADSDIGELILVENNTAGDWGVLYGVKGKYSGCYSGNSYCSGGFIEYRNGYESYNLPRPTVLKVRLSSQKQFPIGLFQIQECFSSRLQHFQMANVGFSEFGRSVLLGADELNVLDLSHNAIEELPSKAFTNARNLIEINLSHNHIARMPSDVFQVEIEVKEITTEMPSSLRFLKVVRLENNNLTTIHREWFENLANLTTLTLNDNFLTRFDTTALVGNFALRTLQLQNNNNTFVRMRDLANQLDVFDISNNPRNIDGPAINLDAKTLSFSHTNSRQLTIFDRTGVASRSQSYRFCFGSKRTEKRIT